MKNILRLLFVGTLLSGILSEAGEFKVDPSRSSIVAEVHASPPHSFEVILKDYEAVLNIDETESLSSASLSFQFADLDSDNGGRDKKMYYWMDTEKNPEVSFEMVESIVREDSTIAQGNLKMHGVRKLIEIPYTIRKDKDSVVLDGEVQIDHRDWNLEIIKLFIFKVKPALSIRIHIEGTIKNN